MSDLLIFGEKGFIASSFISFLKKNKISFESVSSKNIDLTSEESAKKLTFFNKKYKIIFLSAITPDRGKDDSVFIKNILMVSNFFKFFKKENIDHFYYFSSDAVYNLDYKIIDENTPATPNDLYGLMHLTRERIIQNYVNDQNRTIFRLTLVYGKGDTHNSYGPNRFAREILEKNKITIFNDGIDTRDFIFIDDVINILYIFTINKISGLFNLATGKSNSFIDIAKILNKISNKNNTVIVKLRNSNKVTYRKFNIKKLKKKINYKITSIIKGYSFYFK
jgi:nucleoside-diphosphate-sugar epimerase